jgi:hypothetical protein
MPNNLSTFLQPSTCPLLIFREESTGIGHRGGKLLHLHLSRFQAFNPYPIEKYALRSESSVFLRLPKPWRRHTVFRLPSIAIMSHGLRPSKERTTYARRRCSYGALLRRSGYAKASKRPKTEHTEIHGELQNQSWLSRRDFSIGNSCITLNMPITKIVSIEASGL